MSAVRIVLVLCGGLFLVLGPLMPPNGDLWWQRWLGDTILQTHHLPTALGPETFTSAGAPWVPQEWFLSLLVALAARSGGYFVLSMAFAAIPVGILISIYFRTRARAAPVAIAVALLCCGIALQASFGVRAQVLGWGCFAIFLLCLDRNDGWYYAAIAAVIVWANVHASAAVAPIFLAVRIVGATIQGGLPSLRTSRDLRILPLVAVALLCTPLGWHLPAYAGALAMSPIRHYIEEWQPPTFSDPEFLFGALPLALFVALGGLKGPTRSLKDVLPIVLLFAGSLLARRNAALFAIAAAPMAAWCLDYRFPKINNSVNRIAGVERFAIIAIGVAFAATGTLYAWLLRHGPPAVPAVAISRLAADGDHRLLCENFSDCSLALQYPNVHVFMDGRCDPFPLSVWQRYVAAIRLEAGWQSMLRAYGVDAVVAPRASRLARAMQREAGWRSDYDDSDFVLYVRAKHA